MVGRTGGAVGDVRPFIHTAVVVLDGDLADNGAVIEAAQQFVVHIRGPHVLQWVGRGDESASELLNCAGKVNVCVCVCVRTSSAA